MQSRSLLSLGVGKVGTDIFDDQLAAMFIVVREVMGIVKE